MKSASTLVILAILFVPSFVFAQESLVTDRLQASFNDNGNWQLTDNVVNITWHGEWFTKDLMKVTGSDNSCFIIGENQDGMVELDCKDLKEISILLSH